MGLVSPVGKRRFPVDVEICFCPLLNHHNATLMTHASVVAAPLMGTDRACVAGSPLFFSPTVGIKRSLTTDKEDCCRSFAYTLARSRQRFLCITLRDGRRSGRFRCVALAL